MGAQFRALFRALFAPWSRVASRPGRGLVGGEGELYLGQSQAAQAPLTLSLPPESGRERGLKIVVV